MFKRIIAFIAFFVLISTIITLEAESRYDVLIGDSLSQYPEYAPVTLIKFIDYQ